MACNVSEGIPSMSINFARRTLELHFIIIKGAKLFSSWENVSRIWWHFTSAK